MDKLTELSGEELQARAQELAAEIPAEERETLTPEDVEARANELEAVKADTVRISSTSGDMQLGVYQCGKVNVSATSGDIILTAVHGSGMTVDFKTTSGSLNGKSVKNARHVVGDGVSAVTVSTTSGDLKTVEQ